MGIVIITGGQLWCISSTVPLHAVTTSVGIHWHRESAGADIEQMTALSIPFLVMIVDGSMTATSHGYIPA